MSAVLNTFVRLRTPSSPPPSSSSLRPSLAAAAAAAARPLRFSKPPAFSQTAHFRTLSDVGSFVNRPVLLGRGGRLVACPAASHEDSKHSEIEVEKAKSDFKSRDSQEAWQETLEAFKEQALKMQAVSREAYEVYSRKATEILKETSAQWEVQSEKAKREIEESKEHLSTMIENSPKVKDIIETYSSSANELRQPSQIQDFHVGIPYGLFLSLGGFLSFMLVGSISAIRFGVILGGVLLALSILNMRLWKEGKPSSLYLKGQGAIAVIVFLRELRYLFYQGGTFLNTCMAFLSGAIAVFYLLKITRENSISGSSPEPSPEPEQNSQS